MSNDAPETTSEPYGEQALRAQGSLWRIASDFARRNPEYGVLAFGLLLFVCLIGLTAFVLRQDGGVSRAREIGDVFLWFVLVSVALVLLNRAVRWLGKTLADDEKLRRAVRWLAVLTIVFWVALANITAAGFLALVIMGSSSGFSYFDSVETSVGVQIVPEEGLISKLFSFSLSFLSPLAPVRSEASVPDEVTSIDPNDAQLGLSTRPSSADLVSVPEDDSTTSSAYNECLAAAKANRETAELEKCIILK